MKNARLSMLVFGFYMLVVVGFGFMTIPHQILHIFGLSAGDNVWIRMMGMLGSIIGFYYIKVVRSGLDTFIPWTVPGRYYAAAFMALLVILKMVGPSLLLFAAVDSAFATWTWFALRSDKKNQGSASLN